MAPQEAPEHLSSGRRRIHQGTIASDTRKGTQEEEGEKGGAPGGVVWKAPLKDSDVERMCWCGCPAGEGVSLLFFFRIMIKQS